jgi:carboxypeptidase family protein
MKIRLLAGLLAVPVLVTVYAVAFVNRSPHGRQYAATSSHQEVAKPTGAISGRVLDAEGQPVKKARVQAFNTEFGMGKVPTAYTNEQGVFLIENLPPGTYTLPVAKEEDGYPAIDSTFYYSTSARAEQVVVYGGKTLDAVPLQLGQKLAKLTGRIVDSTTRRGVVVEGVLVTLHRTDNPQDEQTITTDEDGNFEVIVPPVPTIMEVSAPGYKKKSLKLLPLMRGEVGPLQILLHPAKQE